ncbi:peptide deformylase [Coriobacteriia bacterium Es71-Z0120]|jgi:peptide deformylase|uniref:peptide deformylase n=1 Tax=Parvivirga hydrogeniphila TaxID=2939460 RepID=UPI002260B41B|nr:peptide deformylase [Parvivirga hydrogeniphila]MCL4079537.1 peptide deformylase [Parvivirga hydrogeniphila]
MILAAPLVIIVTEGLRMRILTYPDPGLKQRAVEVDPATDPSLRDLVTRMARAMYDAEGIGLAATQVGVLKRVIVYDLEDGLHAVCNPRIVDRSEQTEVGDEGCLSVPGISVPVERAASVVCEGVSLDGKRVVIHAEGLLARLFQHEIDHLDGVVILDRLSPEERKAALRAYREAQTQTV